MVDTILKFHGTDWVGMIFGLLSTVYLAREKRVGFVYGAVCGGGWLAFGVITESFASILSNVLVIGFNCHGWLRWKKKHKGR